PGRGPGEVATLVTAGRRGEAAGREGGCDQQDRDGGEGVAVCGRQGDQGGEAEGGAGLLGGVHQAGCRAGVVGRDARGDGVGERGVEEAGARGAQDRRAEDAREVAVAGGEAALPEEARGGDQGTGDDEGAAG